MAARLAFAKTSKTPSSMAKCKAMGSAMDVTSCMAWEKLSSSSIFLSPSRMLQWDSLGEAIK